MSTHEVSLEGETVAIATGHLTNRLNSMLQQNDGGGDRTHPEYSPTAIGNINGVNPTLEGLSHFNHMRWVTAFGGCHLGGN
jgi:hypothetical protein